MEAERDRERMTELDRLTGRELERVGGRGRRREREREWKRKSFPKGRSDKICESEASKTRGLNDGREGPKTRRHFIRWQRSRKGEEEDLEEVQCIWATYGSLEVTWQFCQLSISAERWLTDLVTLWRRVEWWSENKEWMTWRKPTINSREVMI